MFGTDTLRNGTAKRINLLARVAVELHTQRAEAASALHAEALRERNLAHTAIRPTLLD